MAIFFYHICGHAGAICDYINDRVKVIGSILMIRDHLVITVAIIGEQN